MGLYQVQPGAQSDPNDLNQVVNLLNGTTTNIQMTVNGPISAQMSGLNAMRYVGGTPTPATATFANQYSIDPQSFWAPISVPLTYGAATTSSNGTYYGSSDMAWAPGGPLALGSSAPTSQGWDTSFNPPQPVQTGPITLGLGGYACRVHQSSPITVPTTANFPNITGDTVDFDPRGMFQPAANQFTGGNRAITIPFPGVWAFLAAVHAAAGTNPVGWEISLSSGLTLNELASPFADISSSATNTYTGSVGFTVISMTFESGRYLAPGSPYQVSLNPVNPPSSPFSLDVSGPDRTFIACWLVG